MVEAMDAIKGPEVSAPPRCIELHEVGMMDGGQVRHVVRVRWCDEDVQVQVKGTLGSSVFAV